MSGRALLALSALVSAFVWVVVGAAATLVIRPSPAPAARPGETVSVDVVRRREAEYRRLLDEANARLRAQQAALAAAESTAGAEASPARFDRRGHEERDEGRASREHRHARGEEDDDG